MKLEKHTYYIVQGLVVLLFAWIFWGVFQNSNLISSVTISLNDYSIEHRDATFGELGKADEAPDYRLMYLSKKGWQELGSFANTWIGSGLEFKPEQAIRRKDIIELRLVDADTGEDDLLEHFAFDKKILKGRNYTITASTRVDWKSGFSWFY
ncbi:MAG: hypothetical protein AB3N63_07230 [Puniceicoccaceae bacterium]